MLEYASKTTRNAKKVELRFLEVLAVEQLFDGPFYEKVLDRDIN